MVRSGKNNHGTHPARNPATTTPACQSPRRTSHHKHTTKEAAPSHQISGFPTDVTAATHSSPPHETDSSKRSQKNEVGRNWRSHPHAGASYRCSDDNPVWNVSMDWW